MTSERIAKRLLLLMTTRTYRATAFLEAAGRLGVPVTVGSDVPQILEAANPAGHLTLRFDDRERAVASIAAFAHPFSAIVATDDDGLLLAAEAAAALGLPHNPVTAVARARDKSATRQALKNAGLRTPRFVRLPVDGDPEALARDVFYPCVVKPLALSASRGVIRANDEAEFAQAFRRVKRILAATDRSHAPPEALRWILVEEYVDGREVALEGLLDGGMLRVLALYDKPDPLAGPYFEESIYVTPSRADAGVKKSIEDAARRGAAALGLTRGPVHIELRFDERGPWILEMAPRTIGGLCARTLRFGAGEALEDVVLRHALGLPVASYEREQAASGVMMIPIPRGGILRGVRGAREARAVAWIEDLMITVPTGERVVPLPEGDRYLGFIFARAETPAIVETALREAHARLDFAIEQVDTPGEGG